MGVHLTSADRDPRGGLTASGRAKYNAEGAHLRPGVLRVRSTTDLRRKGSFLRRFYGRRDPHPLTDGKGRPTRYALAAHAWGEPVPKTSADVRRLAALGEKLLAKYHQTRTRHSR